MRCTCNKIRLSEKVVSASQLPSGELDVTHNPPWGGIYLIAEVRGVASNEAAVGIGGGVVVLVGDVVCVGSGVLIVGVWLKAIAEVGFSVDVGATAGELWQAIRPVVSKKMRANCSIADLKHIPRLILVVR